jgi:hypothetical protein
MADLFEIAIRQKFRFASPKGDLTAEDLWDLPLTRSSGVWSSTSNSITATKSVNLDDIARALHKQLKSGDDVSFVTTEKSSDPTIQAKFDLIIHVINVKKAEKKAAEEAKEKAAKKQQLLSILAAKQDEALHGMTMEELRAAIAAL